LLGIIQTNKIKSLNNLYPKVDREWTLFLDRDGVLNKRLEGRYVTTPQELIILPGVGEAMSLFSSLFDRIIIVTNQQGIGKEIMSHQDLSHVHDSLLTQISFFGGRIDEIYYCPDLAHEDSPNRKPNPGMGFQAKKDFPEINFRKSIMIGDSESDIQFGKALKMITVRISKIKDHQADFTHPSLKDFSIYLNS
jgi:histidinol-phosphate phosphatase family protein